MNANVTSRSYANDREINKGTYAFDRKEHESALNKLRKQWREEFLERERMEKAGKELEREREKREQDERRKKKLLAFEDKTGERAVQREVNYKLKLERRAKTEAKLKQKENANERRSRWRNVELYAEAEKWITPETLDTRIEQALKRPERMY